MIQMKYFKESEFGAFWDLMDPELLPVMDTFRECWGAPVIISPAKGAIGRTDGTSFHNYKRHGMVKAVDLMPRGMNTAEDRKRAFDCAVQAGATGIGIYPDWKPNQGIHIDVGVRSGRGVGNPARWAGVRSPSGGQIYVEIGKVF